MLSPKEAGTHEQIRERIAASYVVQRDDGPVIILGQAQDDAKWLLDENDDLLRTHKQIYAMLAVGDSTHALHALDAYLIRHGVNPKDCRE